MSGIHSYSRALALALVFAALPLTDAFAHCFVGARFFPATLAVDDPCVADELSLPTISWSRTADMPPATEWDVSAEVSKRITEDFGISIGDVWSQIRGPGGPTMAGFGNLETTAQYQLLKDNSHELAMLLGLIVDWGGTGASNSGIATPYTTLTPTYYFGKGFGDLPDSAGWLRAFAVTGQIGYRDSEPLVRPGAASAHSAGAGMGRLDPIQHAVSEIGDSGSATARFHQSPDPDRRVPDVDAGRKQLRQQFRHHRHGQSGRDLGRQLFPGRARGAGAGNAQSGHGIGVLGQLHLYLDDMFPKTIGQPLIGTSAPPQQLKF